jgi:hypothetical protein
LVERMTLLGLFSGYGRYARVAGRPNGSAQTVSVALSMNPDRFRALAFAARFGRVEQA